MSGRSGAPAAPGRACGAGPWTFEGADLWSPLRVRGETLAAPESRSARASIDSLRDLRLTPGAQVVVRIDPEAISVFDDVSAFIQPQPVHSKGTPT